MFFNILLSFKNIPELKVFIHILIFILMHVLLFPAQFNKKGNRRKVGFAIRFAIT